MTNLSELIQSGATAMLVVSASDLRDFAMDVYRYGRESMKPERTEPYTREEVARMFHVTPRTVDIWRKCGMFGTPQKVGRRVVIPCDAVDRILNS